MPLRPHRPAAPLQYDEADNPSNGWRAPEGAGPRYERDDGPAPAYSLLNRQGRYYTFRPQPGGQRVLVDCGERLCDRQVDTLDMDIVAARGFYQSLLGSGYLRPEELPELEG